MSARGDVVKLLRRARQIGFKVEATRSSHWRLIAPSGEIEVVGSTPKAATISALLRTIQRVERQQEVRKCSA